MSQDKVLIIIVAVISILAIISYLASPFFAVNSIEINKLAVLTGQEIKESLASYQGSNIWIINKDEIRGILKGFKYVKSLEVDKQLPATLKIEIKERVPLAKINNNGKFIVFDSDGYILEEGAFKTRASVPLIKGVGYSFEDERLIFPETIMQIVQALKELNSEARAMIEYVEYKDDKTLSMQLKSKVQVLMGDLTEVIEKFKILNSVLTKIAEEKMEVDYIDLRIVERPVIKK